MYMYVYLTVEAAAQPDMTASICSGSFKLIDKLAVLIGGPSLFDGAASIGATLDIFHLGIYTFALRPLLHATNNNANETYM
jgi:hypothetical protein